jgi:hypothetical protein
LIFAICAARSGVAQNLNVFDDKWCFTGLRTTVFKVSDNHLYVGLLEYTDTTNFNHFVLAQPLDSAVYKEAVVERQNDTIIISASFPQIDHHLRLAYSSTDSNHIWFMGDVYFDSTRAIVTNSVCTMSRPGCVNRLYNRADLNKLTALKSRENFTRDDAFEFLLRLNEKLKSKCNRCYAGFTDAYMNEVLIEMGFNPIVKKTVNNSVWYNTSGFGSFIKEKFSKDKTVVKLAEYVFDWYIK